MCSEISDNYGLSETAQNKPDLVVRVDKVHLNELMVDIKDRHVLGMPIVHEHFIEFPKIC